LAKEGSGFGEFRKIPRSLLRGASFQDAKKAHQQKKPVILFVSFVWLNQTDQMKHINKTNQFAHPAGIFSSRSG
jgi:hypothetical protein